MAIFKSKEEKEAEKRAVEEKRANQRYIVRQVVLNEDAVGTGSNALTLQMLENTINEQADKGYNLHSFSTCASGSKGLGGGDRIQVTMVFEKIMSD